jgi:hypothetical protein
MWPAASPVGPEQRYCRVEAWNSYSHPDQLLIQVRCFDAAGTLADADFAVAYLRAP